MRSFLYSSHLSDAVLSEIIFDHWQGIQRRATGHGDCSDVLIASGNIRKGIETLPNLENIPSFSTY